MQVKRIEKHPNYIVSTEGDVFREKKDGFHQIVIDDSNGYSRVDIDGKKESVARLVLEAFRPSTNPARCKASHIDGNKTNCALSNLVWLTQSEVMLYARYTPEYRKQMFAQ
jgi:hypothetical protein